MTIIFLADKRKVHQQWIECRFLTERLRTAIFFVACGLKPAPVTIPAHAQTEFQATEWTIRVSNEIIRNLEELKGCNSENYLNTKAFIQEHWIQKQVDFHTQKAFNASQSSRLLEIAGQLAFIAAIIVSALHLSFFLAGITPVLNLVEKPLFFLAVILPASGAAIGGFRAHRDYSRLAMRSRNMVCAFNQINERMRPITSLTELQGVLADIEFLTLQETQEWFFLTQFSRIEPT